MPQGRRILLAIAGLTPQVVTETLYALWQERPAELPDTVHVVSTREGIDRVRLTLLSEDPGWFARLSQDYVLPPIEFTADHLHVLADGDGQPLSDIQNQRDSVAAADGITAWVRRLTEDPNDQLHVSIAGGRKTMGFYAGYALSLYGRPQDRLSHVLVSPPYEAHPEFFYPTRHSRVIYSNDRSQKPLDCRDATVSLADLPFVRLRHGIPPDLLHGRTGFASLVDAAQRALGPPQLVFDAGAGCVLAAGQRIEMARAELAFYAWLARRRTEGQEAVAMPAEGAPEAAYGAAFLTEYRRLLGSMDDDERVAEGLREGMDKNYFARRKSRVNQALRNALGVAAEPYLIAAQGGRPRTRFGLKLPAEAIRFQ
jgi:CRISPR-associated protein (TIGR02584 family)